MNAQQNNAVPQQTIDDFLKMPIPMELFVQDDNLPMQFAISPGRNAEEADYSHKLKTIIESGGGNLGFNPNKMGHHTILLIKKGDIILDPKHDMFKVKFIYDCMKERHLVDLGLYRANVSIYDDSIDPNLVLNGQKSWRDMKRRVLNEDVSSDISEDENVVVKLHGFSSKARRPYSFREEKDIVNFIIDHKLYTKVKGNAIWHDMEKAKVCVGRTWQSLKERYNKRILSDLLKFKLETKIANKLLKGANKDAKCFPEKAADGWLKATKTVSVVKPAIENATVVTNAAGVSEQTRTNNTPITDKISEFEVTAHALQDGVRVSHESTDLVEPYAKVATKGSEATEHKTYNDSSVAHNEGNHGAKCQSPSISSQESTPEFPLTVSSICDSRMDEQLPEAEALSPADAATSNQTMVDVSASLIGDSFVSDDLPTSSDFSKIPQSTQFEHWLNSDPIPSRDPIFFADNKLQTTEHLSSTKDYESELSRELAEVIGPDVIENLENEDVLDFVHSEQVIDSGQPGEILTANNTSPSVHSHPDSETDVYQSPDSDPPNLGSHVRKTYKRKTCLIRSQSSKEEEQKSTVQSTEKSPSLLSNLCISNSGEDSPGQPQRVRSASEFDSDVSNEEQISPAKPNEEENSPRKSSSKIAPSKRNIYTSSSDSDNEAPCPREKKRRDSSTTNAESITDDKSGRSSKRRKARKRKMSCEESSDEEMNSSSSDSPPKRRRKEAAHRSLKYRAPFHFDEDMKILKFIEKNECYCLAKGTMMWKKMEARRVVKGRTWQSLKERYFKRILPRFDNYKGQGLSAETEKKMATTVTEKREKRPALNAYKHGEDVKILDFISKNKRYSEVRGTRLWKSMERRLKTRSWQSMKERFRKHILGNLGKYNLPAEERRQYKMYCQSKNEGLTDSESDRSSRQTINKRVVSTSTSEESSLEDEISCNPQPSSTITLRARNCHGLKAGGTRSDDSDGSESSHELPSSSGNPTKFKFSTIGLPQNNACVQSPAKKFDSAVKCQGKDESASVSSPAKMSVTSVSSPAKMSVHSVSSPAKLSVPSVSSSAKMSVPSVSSPTKIEEYEAPRTRAVGLLRTNLRKRKLRKIGI